jgi:hypothetical protein
LLKSIGEVLAFGYWESSFSCKAKHFRLIQFPGFTDRAIDSLLLNLLIDAPTAGTPPEAVVTVLLGSP